MNGNKTYAMTALAAIGATVAYAQTVLTSGFDFQTFMTFISSAAIAGAIAALRHAIAKGK